MRMLADLLHIQHVGVACLACVMTGKLHRMRCDLAKGGPAVMAILPKRARNHVPSYHPEREKCDDEKSRKSKQVPCIFEHVEPTHFSCGSHESNRTAATCDPD